MERPGQPKGNQSGLPYGCGSLQQRGLTWWIMFRDPLGRNIQENSRLTDYNAARRLLAERALETAKAKVAALEQIIHEAEETGSPAHRSQPDGDGAERGPGRGTVSKDSKVRQKRTGAKGGR